MDRSPSKLVSGRTDAEDPKVWALTRSQAPFRFGSSIISALADHRIFETTFLSDIFFIKKPNPPSFLYPYHHKTVYNRPFPSTREYHYSHFSLASWAFSHSIVKSSLPRRKPPVGNGAPN